MQGNADVRKEKRLRTLDQKGHKTLQKCLLRNSFVTEIFVKLHHWPIFTHMTR